MGNGKKEETTIALCPDCPGAFQGVGRKGGLVVFGGNEWEGKVA
jgi:hypothetical protein